MEEINFGATDVRHLGNGIALICMKPEVRDCMDEAIAQWREHWPDVLARMPKDHEPDEVYSFAYWLFRYSGLIRPVSGIERKDQDDQSRTTRA